MKARLHLCVTSTVAIAHFLVARPASAGGCEKDADCKGDRICEKSVCVSPPAPLTQPVPQTQPASPAQPAPEPPPQSATAAPVLGEALSPRVEASFASAPGSAFEVSVADSDGPKRCIAPCSLQLTPGDHLVEVRGTRTFSSKLVVPAGGGAFDIQAATPASRAKPLGFLIVGLGVLGVGIYGITQENLLIALPGVIIGTSTTAVSAIMLAAAKPSGSDSVTLRGATASHQRKRPLFVAAPTRGGVAAAVELSF